ncbi:3-isopropylmalate/(R)-2-methylmalate dehydratase small subunit [Albimonas donghaensis]|uniref:3-isopropylmalate dehydratase n=1 Tax=Albimonas donghaensis TaxID=356660 RepID=A0A1H3DQC7_9RHOB|nr:3-isopropylmalate dehydratase small subunit [Albimonas donghaensis]SDX68732.1 3-isopropylmalate/(R)-2-methylmalate dehydratase small subunit [Albimonas donghaensis]
MDAFTTLRAPAMPINAANVDTDQIIPARYLARGREAQREACFHDLRFDRDGTLRPDFPMNRPVYADARILVAGRNFGCGSSRESAVTTLVDNGFRAFVAPSFGDIFLNNCFQNGALPVRLPTERVEALLAALEASPGAELSVDLPSQTVTGPDGVEDGFEIDGFRKDCLLRGVDVIDLTLSHAAQIAAFEARQSQEVGWLDRLPTA